MIEPGVFLLVVGAALFLTSKLGRAGESIRRMNAVIGVLAVIAGLALLLR